MMDLETKNLVMKVTWPNRWFIKNRLAELPWIYEGLPIKNSKIWYLNLNAKDVVALLALRTCLIWAWKY